jgi:low temperature requirement protein LtrA
VLGEAIVSVATGVAEADWQWRAVLTAVAGFASAACAWWLYFRRADPTVISRAVRGIARDRLVSYVYGYSHLLVFAGITAGGVGVQVAIEGAAEPLPLPARIALCGGTAVTLLGMDLIDWAAPSPLPRMVLLRRALAGMGAIVLIALGGLVTASTLVSLLAGLIVALTAVEGMESTEQAQPAAEERDLAAH